MEAPRPLATAQKNTQQEIETSEDIKIRRGINRGGRDGCTGDGGKSNMFPSFGTNRGLVRQKNVDRDRQRLEGTPVWDNPGADRDLGTG